jgi:Flp pilus assembly protein TadD
VLRVAITLLAALLVACATVDAARLFHSGTAALDRGDAPAAVRDLEAAVQLLPDSSAAHNHLGLAYAAAERPRDALREFERAVAIDCDNQAAQTNLAGARQRARSRAGN